MLRPNELVISDDNFHLFLDDQVVDGEGKSRGLIPRNYDTHPVGYLGCCPPMEAVDMPLIPRSEWSERLRDKVATKSLLSDIRLTGNAGDIIPALDQNGVGYCWAHSTTSCVTVLRAVSNLPYVPLSAYSVAATIKHGADEGGWGSESLEFATSKGIVSQAIWPQGDRNYRKYDKPEVWSNAALHRVTEGWVDLQASLYDRKLTFDQVGTLLLSDNPVVGDFSWWSHSVALLDIVDGANEWGNMRSDSGKLLDIRQFTRVWGFDTVTGGFGVRILNSWGNWQDRGMGVLAGNKAVPDGGCAPRVTVPSVV